MPLRLLMLGTGKFALPTFERLLDSPHEMKALITRPARPVHNRGRELPNPMRQLAEKRGLMVFAPEDINAAESQAQIAALAPELLVVCDYGQILSSQALGLARLGGINLHGSLLPKYRGAAPINWALYHGETETGVTVIHMTPQLDAGPALVKIVTSIEQDETAPEVEDRLAQLGAAAVLNAIEVLESGCAQPIPQDPAQATPARRLRKSDGGIDWRRSAFAIRNQVRAMQPWPGTSTFWLRSDSEPIRLILDRVSIQPAAPAEHPGSVIEASNSRLVIATGDGHLVIDRLQPAGKRMLSAEEFLRGYPVQVGHQLGDPENPAAPA